MTTSLALPPMTPVVKKLLVVTFVVHAVVLLLSYVAEPLFRGISAWLSVNPDVWTFYKAPALWQFFTYGFLHDTHNIFHILWNMLQLYFFGTLLESLIGSRRFVAAYFGAMVAGGVLHLVSQWIAGPHVLLDGSQTYSPVIGASGAVMGVLVACAVLRPHTKVLLIFIPISLWVLASALVAIDFFSELRNWKSGTTDYIAHWAHIGGALYGGLAAWRGWIWIDWGDRLAKRREEKVVEKRQTDDQRLDELLAKVHRDGIQSLTKAERDFLNRMSNRGRS